MEKSSAAVLFVHGIQGQPKQFRFLIDALPPEAEARAILLPGHGKTARELEAVGRAEWISAVRTETEALLAQGKRVVYVGHSMGCLLGLEVSRQLGHPYAGMLLLCCPFWPSFAARITEGIRSIGNKSAEEDPRVTASREGNSVRVEGFRDQLRLFPPYADLLRLMGRARRMRPRAPERIRFFFAGRDEVVSAWSVSLARKWPRASVRVLEGCGHCYFPQPAARILQSSLNELVTEASK